MLQEDFLDVTIGLASFLALTVAVCLYTVPVQLIALDLVAGLLVAVAIRDRHPKMPSISTQPEPVRPENDTTYKKAA